ncbi:hypothetical protein A1D31_20140 [Bradyrhizobium liaoningense]|nr:hypothetical protein A1D31_20140 [Bradyrhizobium liaoningense]
MMRMALPIISLASPMLLLYRSLLCATAAATNGTTCGAANVSRSSWQMTSSRLQTMLWKAFEGMDQLARKLHGLALHRAPDRLLHR